METIEVKILHLPLKAKWYDMQESGEKTEEYRQLTEYWRKRLIDEDTLLILVDHNEKNQAVNGADSADILEIIDHHRLRTIEPSGPVFFRNQPLGSTCTII